MNYYFDHAATGRVLEPVLRLAVECMREDFGNPSSLHTMGLSAGRRVDEARASVAGCLGATPAEIVFTSGGTEAANLAIFGAARKNKHVGRHIVSTAIEHPATLECLQFLGQNGYEVTLVSPEKDGTVALDAIAAALRGDTALVAMMAVNNETGVCLPIRQIGTCIKERDLRALFYVDAVQGFSKIPLFPEEDGIELMSLSGHKIGAPKGVGALYVRQGLALPPRTLGGGQERGLRSGTEAVPLIAGFGLAASLRCGAMAENEARVLRLREAFREQMEAHLPFAVWNAEGLPYIANLSLPSCPSEVMLRLLSDQGVFVSAGSSCAKGRESHVLRAMKLPPERLQSALRISFWPENTMADVDALVHALVDGANRLKRR